MEEFVRITLFFFERTILDECVSIDIAEKYNGIALGGHNQEKEKETRQQRRRVGLGHQHAPNTTPLKHLRLVGLGRRRKPHNTPRDNNVRSDWAVDTDETTSLGLQQTTVSTFCSRRQLQPRADKEREKPDRTTPKKATAKRNPSL